MLEDNYTAVLQFRIISLETFMLLQSSLYPHFPVNLLVLSHRSDLYNYIFFVSLTAVRVLEMCRFIILQETLVVGLAVEL